MPLKVLGHLWYSDKVLGEFVKKAENKYKNSLFCFTGDHYGRRFINGTPTLYESSSVPFIIYGNSLRNTPQKINTPGSHIDITPTLLEMVAPDNFTYYSFGSSLFNSYNKNLGIGFNKIISKSKLQHFTKNYGIKNYDLKSKKQVTLQKSFYKKEYDNLMSLSWHYLIKGDSLPPNKH